MSGQQSHRHRWTNYPDHDHLFVYRGPEKVHGQEKVDSPGHQENPLTDEVVNN